MERRLAAILSIDVVGYSRLMGADEAGTLAALKAHRRELIDPKAAQYGGRTIKLMGDGALMEFPSVVDAVSFAVEVQSSMPGRNDGLPQDRQVLYRIGINIGDVIVEGDDIFGDGVNIAARLEGLAEPGGICVARNVYDQVKGKLDLDFEPLGERAVKNIAEPVSVYRLELNDKAERLVTAARPGPVRPVASRPGPRLAPVAAGIALVALMGLAAWWHPWAPRTEPPALQGSAVPAAGFPAIAVLPFDNMSGDAALDYFSDGMTEDIITELSKIPDIRVVSRNTSFTYKGKAVTARQVSDELGTRYVLEGSVRKQGDKVRITAQLVDGTTDAHVWAERFDEEGTDIFALQDRITAKIGSTLGGGEGRIKQAEYRRAWEVDAAKLEEYDYYLRGHSIFYAFTPEAMLEARRIWQDGLAKYPDSGLLRIKIAWTHFHNFRFGWSDEPEAELERAYALTQEGLADQHLPRVGRWAGHFLNALVQLFRNRDHDRALEEAEATLDIVPNDTETLAVLSWVPAFAGDPDLAVEWAARAIDREVEAPAWYYRYLGLALAGQGNCDKAVEAYAVVTWVAVAKSATLAMCYVELGRIDDARAELARLFEARPGLTAERLRARLPYRRQADRDRLFAALAQAGLPE